MEKKEFFDVTREYFKSIGFDDKLSKNKFYYDADDYVLVVAMIASNFSEIYYIDYWLSFKALHLQEKISLKNLEVDAQGRFGDGQNQLEIEYKIEDKNAYLKQLEHYAKLLVEPIIKGGMNDIARNQNIFVYKKDVLNYLKMIQA